ncbi:hypothetical protein ABW21_db0203615 [Orbilia brochopaga]|nr:hypothetical protein ABW21_db0203615 [Drechslerella brochopaga]
MTQALSFIELRRLRCEHCRCNEFGLPGPGPPSGHCPDINFVHECSGIYGCICWADLWNGTKKNSRYRENTHAPGLASHADLQNAINQIPAWLRPANPDWKYWSKGPLGPGGRFLTWPEEASEALQAVTERKPVEGVAEPYTLEGPSRSRHDWTWLAALAPAAFNRLVSLAPGALARLPNMANWLAANQRFINRNLAPARFRGLGPRLRFADGLGGPGFMHVTKRGPGSGEGAGDEPGDETGDETGGDTETGASNGDTTS